MKSKTILGADGATKMRQITVGIHGKGGEAGIKAIQQLAGMDYAEIAEQLDTGKNTPRRWVTGIINELSVLLWGIDEERTAGVVK